MFRLVLYPLSLGVAMKLSPAAHLEAAESRPAKAPKVPAVEPWDRAAARVPWKPPSTVLPEMRPPTKQINPRHFRDLAMVHIPVNFGHTMESAALMTRPWAGSSNNGMQFGNAPSTSNGMQLWNVPSANNGMQFWSVPDPNVLGSFQVKDPGQQWNFLMRGMSMGGEAWGMMHPSLRSILNATGCDTYYSPQKYWDQDVAEAYFKDKLAFGMLRDPYDRLANTFRNQVQGISSLYKYTTRQDVSKREHDKVRNSAKYQEFYDNCDVNGWLQSELAKFKAGDVFRSDCILLPQSEFFDDPHGIVVPIDNRRFPESFNELMEFHGYPIRATNTTVHNYMCNSVTSASFNKRSKELIKEVYARDFELVCEHFGHCNKDELTCLHQFPQMCGAGS